MCLLHSHCCAESCIPLSYQSQFSCDWTSGQRIKNTCLSLLRVLHVAMSMLFGYTLSHVSSAFNHLWSHLITCLNLNLALLVLASCVGLLCLYLCSRYSFTPDALLMWTDWGLSLSEYIVSVLHLYMILSQPILTAYLRCYARLGLLSRSGWLVWPIPSTFILIGAVLHPLVVLSLGWRQGGGERGLLWYLMQLQLKILIQIEWKRDRLWPGDR